MSHNLADEFASGKENLLVHLQTGLQPLSLCSPPLALGLGKLRTNGTEPGRKGAVGNLALSGRGVLIQEVLQ